MSLVKPRRRTLTTSARKARAVQRGGVLAAPETDLLYAAERRPLTPQELARFLGVSPSTIGRAARLGKIPVLRIGNRIRFDAKDVISALKEKG